MFCLCPLLAVFPQKFLPSGTDNKKHIIKDAFARIVVADFHWLANKFRDLDEMSFNIFSTIGGQDGVVEVRH